MQIVAVSRQRLWAISVAVGPRERVIDEERNITPEAPIAAKHERVVSRVRGRFKLVNVPARRVWPRKRVRQRGVYVARAEEVDPPRVNVRNRSSNAPRELVLDATLEVNRIRRSQARIQRANDRAR